MGPSKEYWSRATECAKTVGRKSIFSVTGKNNDPFTNINNKNKKVVLLTM